MDPKPIAGNVLETNNCSILSTFKLDPISRETVTYSCH